MANVKPYWVLVAGLLLLLAFVLVFVAPRLGPGGTRRIWLGPGGTLRPWLGPGGTYHPFYEPFADSPSAKVYMVGTSWCPHCTKAKPEFEKFKATVTNGVGAEYFDAEQQKSAIPPDVAKQVDGYPTIAMVKSDGTVVKHKGARTAEAFHQFVKQNL